MNRVIKFRGKSLEHNIWVYGHYCKLNNRGYIILGSENTVNNNNGGALVTFAEEVDVNTIGEYIGIKDSKGQEVYEGDIILSSWWDDEPQEVKYYDYGFKGRDIRQEIVYGREYYAGIGELLDGCFGKVFEILGNI